MNLAYGSIKITWRYDEEECIKIEEDAFYGVYKCFVNVKFSVTAYTDEELGVKNLSRDDFKFSNVKVPLGHLLNGMWWKRLMLNS